jgi:serine/threonine-protein kinase
MHADLTGQTIGRYLVLRSIGEGGMGQVYAAYDTLTLRTVALKIVRPQLCKDSGQRTKVMERFLREAKVLARVSHPNIVAVYEVGMAATEDRPDERFPWLVMEWIDGGSLREWMDGLTQRPSLHEVLRIWKEAGEGLVAVHETGLIHRDLKPQNVLIGRQDRRIRIADFGLAGLVGLDASSHSLDESGTSPTRTGSRDLQLSEDGTIAGTLHYMSPEQYRGEPLSPRSDIYTFCVCLYEALYGEIPWAPFLDDESHLQTNEREWQPTFPARNAAVPRWLRTILIRGLAQRPQDRYQTMRELLQAIDAGEHRWSRLGARLSVAVTPLALLAGITLMVAGSVPRNEPACAASDEKWRGIWDAAVLENMEVKIGATRDETSIRAWDYVHEKVQSYRAAWSETYENLCTSRASLRSIAFDRQIACLDESRAHLRGLTSTWLQAEKLDLFAMSSAASSLPDLNACTEMRSDDQLFVATGGNLFNEKLARARQDFALFQGAARAGAGDVSTRAQLLTQEALALGDPHFAAELWYERSGLALERAEYFRARELVMQGQQLATRAGYSRLSSLFHAREVYLNAYLLRDFAVADELIAASKAALERAGASSELRRTHFRYAGIAMIAQNRLDLAVDWLTLSLQAALELHDTLAQSATRSNLGVAQYQRNQIHEAIEMESQALALAVHTMGPVQPNAILPTSNLALYRLVLGDFREGLETARRALEIEGKVLGERPVAMVRDQIWLAAHLAALGQYEESRNVLNEAAHEQGTAHRRGHPMAEWAIVRLGWLALAQDDLESADRFAQEGLMLTQNDVACDEGMRANVHRLAAEIALAKGEWQAAAQWIAKGKSFLRVGTGRGIRESIALDAASARVLLASDQVNAARDALAAAMAKQTQIFGDDHFSLSPFLLIESEVHLRRGDAQAARLAITRALANLQSSVEKASPVFLPYRFLLADLDVRACDTVNLRHDLDAINLAIADHQGQLSASRKSAQSQLHDLGAANCSKTRNALTPEQRNREISAALAHVAY